MSTLKKPETWLQWLRLLRCRASIVILLALQIVGCGFNKSGLVDLALLEPTGWKNPSSLLDGDSFADYASAVRQEISSSRIPFIIGNAEFEVRMASPDQFQPDIDCQQVRGIAVLVHGLSDSAFSMRDVARSLADNCYIARTALLPGHGSKPGDLLNVRLSDWIDSVQHLLEHAAEEHEHVIAVGFSLGALLTMSEAIKPDSSVDAIISIAPAFYLTTSPYAELTRWLYPFKRWLDTEKPDDTYRYEAVPTVAVAQTIKAKTRFHRRLKTTGRVDIPWLLIQSANDLVVRASKNQALFDNHAKHRDSQSIIFRGKDGGKSKPILVDKRMVDTQRLIELKGHDESHLVSGLPHVAIHQSPDNPHYGIMGDYRNCGVGGPRPRTDVRNCQEAENLWLGPWNGKAPDGGPYGIATYNPNFDELADYLNHFLKRISTPDS